MAPRALASSFLLFFFFGAAHATTLFSTLPQTLVVTASPKQGQELKAGKDTIGVTWRLNQSVSAGADDKYKKVKVKLCYAPISQHDRAWRKTKDDLKKDKTCQFEIVERPYAAGGKQESFQWKVERDVPSATYFVRAYAYDANGDAAGYGQTTDARKSTNLFEVEAISGRHASVDIAAAAFSAFSVLSLVGFFFAEKKKSKRSVGSK